MTQPPITEPLSKGTVLASITGWAEADGTPHPGPLPAGYNNGVSWSADDSGTLVTLEPVPGQLNCYVHFKNAAGTVTITATAAQTGLPALTWTQPTIIAGPVPSGLGGTIS